MRGTFVRKRLLETTSIAAAVLVAFPAAAQTQDAPTAPVAGQASTQSSSTTLSSEGQAAAGGEIVVTGSRIPHPNLEAASPVTIVGAQEVKQTGTTRVEDLLNALPQVFADQGGNISNGSTGTASVNLRGLGAKRNLVLVNGRRLIPGDPRDPVADINMIPAALIKRVDVLTGGASSVYGADAVAGVVNFVMDTDFSGFKVDAQYSLYNHDNRAGSPITDPLDAKGFGYPSGMSANGGGIDATTIIGSGFDDGRGHVTAYFGYRKINAVTEASRDYSACALASNTRPTGPNDLFSCGGSGTSAVGSFYKTSTRNYYHVEGNQFVPGRVLYNYAPTNYFQRPDERYTAGFFAHYDVSDGFKPYTEFMFMDDRSVAQIAASGDFFNTGTINCDNPLLSAQQVATICTPDNTFVDASGVTRAGLYIGRRNVEGGGRQDDLQHTDYRGVVGARGDIAKGLTYEAYYQYSRVNLSETYRNDFSVKRLTNALDVVNVNGTPTCRSVVDGTDPNCVPYNIFQTGGVTQDALNYLQTPGFQRGQTTEQIANASVTFVGTDYGLTSPFATEGLGLNVGAEYRKEGLNLEVDQEFATGDLAGQGGATTPVEGQFKVSEAFVEASLPLIQDKPGFEDLRLGGGYRRSHYEVAGNGTSNSFDTDTYKAEVQWQILHDIKVRGSYNHAVRAPNVVELFSAQSVALDGSIDPCAGTAPAYSQAQCALTGMTAAQYGNVSPNPASQYNGLLGGNPDLTPEIADSITAGIVFTPTFLPGFQATVDYFDIRLKNQIGTVGADTIITQCLATSDPNFCDLIHRDANGSLSRTPQGYIIDTNLNAGKLSTRGIDAAFSYTHEIGSFGSLGVSMSGTYLDSLITDPTGDPKYDCAGYFGVQCGTPNPKWRHKVRVTYATPGGSSISLAWRHFSHVWSDTHSSDVDLNGVTKPGNAFIGRQDYFDLALEFPVADAYTFRVGANNLLDRTPPINGLALGVIQNGNTFAQVYDALGRYLYAGVTLNF